MSSPRDKQKNRMDFYIDYKFKFENGAEEFYMYKIPFVDYIAGVVAYFDMFGVNLDGTDSSVFNVISSLNAFSKIEDDEYFIDFITTRCKKDALEEFKEEKESEKELDK